MYANIFLTSSISLKMWNTYESMTMIFHITLKTPWWLFIKPFGWFFSKKTISKGVIQSQGAMITKFEGEKFVTLKFLFNE